MRRFTPEQIASKLREADRELGKGLSVKEVCRKGNHFQSSVTWQSRAFIDQSGPAGGGRPLCYRGIIVPTVFVKVRGGHGLTAMVPELANAP